MSVLMPNGRGILEITLAAFLRRVFRRDAFGLCSCNSVGKEPRGLLLLLDFMLGCKCKKKLRYVLLLLGYSRPASGVAIR